MINQKRRLIRRVFGVLLLLWMLGLGLLVALQLINLTITTTLLGGIGCLSIYNISLISVSLCMVCQRAKRRKP